MFLNVGRESIAAFYMCSVLLFARSHEKGTESPRRRENSGSARVVVPAFQCSIFVTVRPSPS